MQNGFVKAVNPMGILLGVGVVAAGIAVALLGVFEVFTLAIGKLALPTWTMYIVGGVVGIVGAFIVFAGADSSKCTKCGKFAVNEDAYFPLEQLSQVVAAVENDQPEGLHQIQKVPKNQMKSEVEIKYCDGCGEFAEVTVGKWQDSMPSEVLPMRVVSGESAKTYRTIAKDHAEWRGDDDD